MQLKLRFSDYSCGKHERLGSDLGNDHLSANDIICELQLMINMQNHFSLLLMFFKKLYVLLSDGETLWLNAKPLPVMLTTCEMFAEHQQAVIGS
jgi:hypothetical protein